MNKLDIDIEELKKEKRVLQSLERLLTNIDFKKAILDTYLNTHPLDLVMSKGVLNLDPQFNQDIDRQLDSVAMFKLYLDQRISRIAVIDDKIIEAETLRDETTRNA